MDTKPETIRYTADIAVVRDDDILLIERGWDPHKGQLALPGGHVDVGETSRQAAARELAEETGIICHPDELEFVGVWDQPERDPRGRYVTAVYSLTVASHTKAHAGDDATRIEWVPLHEHDQLRHLAFDHSDIAWRVWQRDLDRRTAACEFCEKSTPDVQVRRDPVGWELYDVDERVPMCDPCLQGRKEEF